MTLSRRKKEPPHKIVGAFGFRESLGSRLKFDSPRPMTDHTDYPSSGGAPIHYWGDRRRGLNERRGTKPDRKQKNSGRKEADIKKKPAFSLTQEEFGQLREPRPKVWRKTPDGRIILKDRKRGNDRRK